MLCDIPLKYAFSRIKGKREAPELGVYAPVELSEGFELCGVFKECKAPLPLPFVDLAVARHVLAARPLRSFDALHLFLSSGATSRREVLYNTRLFVVSMVRSPIQRAFLDALDALLARAPAAAADPDAVAAALVALLLGQMQDPAFDRSFLRLGQRIYAAPPHEARRIGAQITQDLGALPERAALRLLRDLVAAAKQLMVLALLEEQVRAGAPLSLVNISEPRLEEIRAALVVLRLAWDANEQLQLLSARLFQDQVLNNPREYSLVSDFNMFLERKAFSFLDYPFLFGTRIKSRLMKTELRRLHSRGAALPSYALPYATPEIRVAKRHTIAVSRENIIQDTITQLSKATPDQLSSELRVVFRGEPGIDEGGVSTEFFHIITRRLLSPNFGMFTYNPRTRFFWFNKWLDLSGPDASALLLQFELIGKVFGLAMSNSVNINARFPPVFYKKLVRPDAPLHLSDLAPFDPPLHRSLTEVLAYDGEDFTDVFGLVFAVDKEWLGHRSAHPLVEGGEHIDVTLENRAQFVELYVEFELQRSIERQFDAFRRGFFAVLKCRTFALLTPHDLRLALNGLSFARLERLRNFAQYEGFEGAEHVVRWFWEIVLALPKSKQRKLLQFVTGSDRLPVEGMSALHFKVHANGTNDMMLPTSHVCFNVLMLPKYSSKAVLRERLLTAIENAEGFGLK